MNISVPALSLAEARYIVSVLNDVACSEDTLIDNLAWPLVPNAPGWDHIDRSGFDGQTLLTKLNDWTPTQRIALLDAVDEFWSIDDVPNVNSRLADLGIAQT